MQHKLAMAHSAAERVAATHAVIRHRRQLAALAVQRADHELRRANDAAVVAADAAAAGSHGAVPSSSSAGVGTVDPVGALHAAQTRVALAQSALEAARHEQERVIRFTAAVASSAASASATHAADENSSPIADELSEAAQLDLIQYAQRIVAEARAEHALTAAAAESSSESPSFSPAERRAAHDILLHAVQRLKLTRKEMGLVKVKQMLATAEANEAAARRTVAAAHTNQQRATAAAALKAATRALRRAKVASTAVSGKYMIQVCERFDTCCLVIESIPTRARSSFQVHVHHAQVPNTIYRPFTCTPYLRIACPSPSPSLPPPPTLPGRLRGGCLCALRPRRRSHARRDRGRTRFPAHGADSRARRQETRDGHGRPPHSEGGHRTRSGGRARGERGQRRGREARGRAALGGGARRISVGRTHRVSVRRPAADSRGTPTRRRSEVCLFKSQVFLFCVGQ
jgi:hypothetical protein